MQNPKRVHCFHHCHFDIILVDQLFAADHSIGTGCGISTIASSLIFDCHKTGMNRTVLFFEILEE
jgi:hypothetical protein